MQVKGNFILKICYQEQKIEKNMRLTLCDTFYVFTQKYCLREEEIFSDIAFFIL